MEKTTKLRKPKTDAHPNPRQSNKGRKKRPFVTAPGPGDSLESERREYHENPARKMSGDTYDHHAEKGLED